MSASDPNFEAVRSWLSAWQDDLVAEFERFDGAGRFVHDVWERDSGCGNSRIFKQGRVWEQVGVNYSAVHGRRLPDAALKKRPELGDSAYSVCGVSVVAHPHNPHAPTSHANLRFFVVGARERPVRWWFGGGYDLTPCYGYAEDCRHWHRVAREACDAFDGDLYPRFKRDCDEYFYLPHRKEARGIGGLFFDDFSELGFVDSFALVRGLGESYVQAYLPIVRRRCDMSFTARQREFQLYRRGRYVEFNLLWDRGTRFGIESAGRTESILMSLPPRARWEYGWKPETDSAEERLCSEFLQPCDWLAGKDS